MIVVTLLLSRPAGTLSSIQNGGEGWGEEAPHKNSKALMESLQEMDLHLDSSFELVSICGS